MVIAPPTTAPIFDLSKVTYLKGKSSEQISTAAAVEQPSHAQMVKVVTGFIDRLINLEVGKLATAAGDSSNPEAQQKATNHLNDYNTNKDSSVASFKNEVASGLAKNIYAVKQFLIEGGLAEYKDNQELTFKTKDSVDGGKIAAESAKELAGQALTLVQDKLSAYGINIDNSKATELREGIIRELKAPPSKNETTTTAEKPVDHEKILADITNFTKEISNLDAVKTLLKKDNGLETLSKLNADLSHSNPLTDNEEAYSKALLSFKGNYEQNKAFINQNISNSETFTTKFNSLDDENKLQIQMMLENLELSTKHANTVKEIAESAQEIKKNLSRDAFQQISKELNNLKENSTNENKGNNLDTVNNLLKDFRKDIEASDQLNGNGERLTKKTEALETFVGKISAEFKSNNLSTSDIELIKERLDPNKQETAEQSQKAITERVLKNLNLSEEQLKGFAGIAVAAVVGLMVFCPNAIGNLVKSGTGLAAMAAQTLPMLFQAKAMMQMSQNRDNGHHSETAST